MATQSRNLLSIGLLANIFEWYEYSIFGFLAGLIGQLFFDASQPITELMRGLMLFSISYLARPLGSLFFGLMGDRLGSASALRLSLLLMAIPTVMVGVLPTYREAGILAPFSLCILRLIQGFAAGGELPNSGCYIFEAAPRQHRSILCSCVMASSVIGMLMGSLVTGLILKYFDQATLLSWAWRIPFLLGIPLTLFITYIRRKIHTDQLTKATKSTTRIQGWEHLGKPLLKAVFLISFQSVFFYIFFIWMPSYLQYFLGVSSNIAHFTHTLTIVIALPLYLFMGYLASSIDYPVLIKIGIIGILILLIPAFNGLQQQLSTGSLIELQFLLMPFFVAVHSVWIEMLINLFPAETRSLGVSLAWSISPAFIGSTAPLVCSYVIHKTGWLTFPGFYIMAFGLLALPVAFRLKS